MPDWICRILGRDPGSTERVNSFRVIDILPSLSVHKAEAFAWANAEEKPTQHMSVLCIVCVCVLHVCYHKALTVTSLPWLGSVSWPWVGCWSCVCVCLLPVPERPLSTLSAFTLRGREVNEMRSGKALSGSQLYGAVTGSQRLLDNHSLQCRSSRWESNNALLSHYCLLHAVNCSQLCFRNITQTRMILPVNLTKSVIVLIWPVNKIIKLIVMA